MLLTAQLSHSPVSEDEASFHVASVLNTRIRVAGDTFSGTVGGVAITWEIIGRTQSKIEATVSGPLQKQYVSLIQIPELLGKSANAAPSPVFRDLRKQKWLLSHQSVEILAWQRSSWVPDGAKGQIVALFIAIAGCLLAKVFHPSYLGFLLGAASGVVANCLAVLIDIGKPKSRWTSVR